MSAIYYLNVTVHVLAAMLWLGGMFFLGTVGAPVLRMVEPPSLRQRLFHDLGTRFRRVGWWTIAVLVVTGIVNVYFHGWLHWNGVLGSLRFWQSNAGRALAAKLAAVAVMVSISAMHDFVHGPRAGRAVPGSADAVRFRRRTVLLGRINAIVGVLLVAAAVRLAWGG